MDQPLFGETRRRDRFIDLALIIANIVLFLVSILNPPIMYMNLLIILAGNSANGVYCWLFT